MEKVKVSKEVAEAIESTLRDYNILEIVELHVRGHAAYLKEVDRDTLIRALYIGYEVEETEIDKAFTFLSNWRFTRTDSEIIYNKMIEIYKGVTNK